MAELALRLLRELAEGDPALAKRMRCLGLDPERASPDGVGDAGGERVA